MAKRTMVHDGPRTWKIGRCEQCGEQKMVRPGRFYMTTCQECELDLAAQFARDCGEEVE